MNSYYVTRCPHCDKAEGHEEVIMTHGADNTTKAEKMINEEGMSFEEVKRLVCTNCGGFKDDPDNDYCRCQDY